MQTLQIVFGLFGCYRFLLVQIYICLCLPITVLGITALLAQLGTHLYIVWFLSGSFPVDENMNKQVWKTKLPLAIHTPFHIRGPHILHVLLYILYTYWHTSSLTLLKALGGSALMGREALTLLQWCSSLLQWMKGTMVMLPLEQGSPNFLNSGPVYCPYNFEGGGLWQVWVKYALASMGEKNTLSLVLVAGILPHCWYYGKK